jgi:hypothetical protein
MAAASAFFGACLIFMGREAMFNDRGLIINGLIHLGPAGATIFYWCLAAVSGVFVAIGIPAFFVGLLSSRRVTLTATAISAPKFGFSRAPTVVLLSDVQQVSLQKVQKHRFLNIHHAHGKLAIAESYLSSAAVFEALCSEIIARTPAVAKG